MPGATTELRYGSHPSQYATLSLPPSDGAGSLPVAVIVHGGFWRAAHGCELGVPLAEQLVEHGFAAYNLEYRRVGDDPDAGGGGWPHTCLDVAAAVDLLATDAQEAADGRLDLTRVVAIGHSAGGHLVGWLAGRAGLPHGAPGSAPVVTLAGFVSQAGVLDLSLAMTEQLGAGAASDFLGAGATDPETLRWASPQAQLPSGVPSVCVHGSADDVVGINQSERYVAAATAAGDSSRLVTLEGLDHMAPVDVTSPAWTASLAAATELTR